MAVATDSTPAPARRLLRAAGPCRVLTSTDVLALISSENPVAVEITRTEPRLPAPAGARYARVLRQHDARVSLRAPQGLSANFEQRRHGRFSRSVLPVSVRVRP